MIERYQTEEMRALWSEAERYRCWWAVELAAVEAWSELGTVPREAAGELDRRSREQPLDQAFADRVSQIEAVTRHDIVAFTTALSERYGEAARFVHLGLTSTDVVDTALNLQLSRALQLIELAAGELRGTCLELAVRYRQLPCIGRTHGIHAEPMVFGLKFLNWADALERDLARLLRARSGIEVVMLSGSVGTYAHVDPGVERLVAAKLGWAAAKVTNQTLPRDLHAEVLAALALLGTSLERIALEIRHLQRSEVREVLEPFDPGQTGSSSMPHKKNPIGSENVTGLSRLLRSNLQAALEDVALWHERDISHSSVERVVLPDSTTLAHFATRRMQGILARLRVDEQRVQRNLDQLGGLVFSQRVLHLLIEAGLRREQAYGIVQRASLRCWETGEPLLELLTSDPELPISREQLATAFDLSWYLHSVPAIYARFGL